MTNLWQDLRYGVRILLKKPAFTLIAVITLSLGIGVNTALFAGFNLLLRPNPIKDPETVVNIERQSDNAGGNFSYLDYVYYRDHAQTLSDFLPTIEEKFLLREHTSVVEPVEIKGIFTSDNYLSTLGGNMRLGRFFTQEENRVEGRDAVIVLSHYFWSQRFAGDLNVVGRTLLLNGKPLTVIGVTSPDFVGLQIEMPDVWLPLMMRADKSTLQFAGPKSEDRDWFGEASSINSARVASELATALGSLALLLAMLGLYGVMAFSVAQRTREIGVRMALGAQPSHVQMLVIAQGMKLVLIGVLIGIPISMAASQLVKSMLFGLSTRDPVTYGGVVLLLAIAGLLACWIPARRSAKVNPMIALRCV